MPEYLFPQIAVDPDEITQEAFALAETLFPEWQADPDALDTILLEIGGRKESVHRLLLIDLTTQIFRFYGSSVLGLRPIDATPATASSTWTMTDDAGYTIPAGTEVSVAKAGDDLVGFKTVEDVVVPPGETSVTQVVLVAAEPGEASSSIDSAAEVNPADALSYVAGIALESDTSGGTDDEDDSVYLNRLRELLTLLSPRLILPGDFAIWARQTAGVWRSVAIDNYNPDDDTFGNERMITVAVVDQDGGALGTPVKNAVKASCEAEREDTFVVHVIDPTFTVIDVQVEVVPLEGFDAATVVTNVAAQLASYLDPANWGRETLGTNNRDWTNEDTAYYLEIAEQINRAGGVKRIVPGSLYIGEADAKAFTVAAATDALTSAAHGYSNGDTVVLRTLIPGAPLAIATIYHVRDVAANTFKLATTAGGSAINITGDGSGTVQKLGQTDIALDGVAPLTQPGTITVS